MNETAIEERLRAKISILKHFTEKENFPSLNTF
jgi:hypothetical protein